MPEWFSRLFKGIGGLSDMHNGRFPVQDSSGRTVYVTDRRRQPRQPFRGKPAMRQEDFEQLSIFTCAAVGISLKDTDMPMLESRIMGRLRTLHIATFREYAGFLMSERGIKEELDNFIDAITTGKTHFWRESDHFEFLMDSGAEELLKTRKSIRAWSIGCSTGEEPYTIAISLAEHARLSGEFLFSVLGSDISGNAIRKAQRAEYDKGSVLNLPDHLRVMYLTAEDGIYRVTDNIREAVTFQRFNLLDDDYALNGDIDIAFFRNVGLYFSKDVQKKILTSVCNHLSPGGFLFLGHSESISEFGLPVDAVADTIYVKRAD